MLTSWLLACTPPPPSPAIGPTPTAETGETGTDGTTTRCVEPMPADAPPQCTNQEGAGFPLCSTDLFDGVPVHGTFTRFDQLEVEFVDDLGGVVRFAPDVPDEAPDLVAVGPVTLVQYGYCSGYFGLWTTLLVTDDTGVLQLVVGSEVDVTRDGWRVEAGESPCPAVYGVSCNDCGRNVPLHVTGPGVDVTLWQGESADSGGLRVHVAAASYGAGSSSLCEGFADFFGWWAAPP